MNMSFSYLSINLENSLLTDMFREDIIKMIITIKIHTESDEENYKRLNIDERVD